MAKEKTIVKTPPVSQETHVHVANDNRYNIAPEPIYMNTPIPTRGLPQSYQQLGIIKTESGLYPLYGRRIDSTSSFYHYYTRTDTYNPLPLPIYYNKRDCQDINGCYELYNGDEVIVAPSKEKGIITIYRSNGLTYIPSVL